MIDVILSIGADSVSTDMAGQDELAQLEMERDRLLSMIAYHNDQFDRTRRGFPAPKWFVAVAIAIICGIGISIVAGVLAGQISVPGVLFLVVGLALLAYISTRRITVFGTPFFVGDILALFGSTVAAPIARPGGEHEAHQRLTDCEARIVKLREGRP
jgi:uncharacterized membrane protein YphA (DoxX/SURF4 family)